MKIYAFVRDSLQGKLQDVGIHCGWELEIINEDDFEDQFWIEGEDSCLLLDEHIEDVDLSVFCEKVREIDKERQVPILLLTDKDTVLDEFDVLSCGMDTVVSIDESPAFIKSSLERKLELIHSIRKNEFVEDWIELELNNETQYVKEVATYITKVLKKSNIPQEAVFKLEYCFREMIDNAWEHGNLKDSSKKINVASVLFDDRLIIKITDEGSGFSLKEVEDPMKDPIGAIQRRMDAGKRAGGWGMSSVRQIMDEVIYNENGNTVLLVKYFSRLEEDSLNEE
ncbi:MAG: hypothetical protein COA79_09010 [Planctomycetota bacterium]|nr:MAG: hypothetical protein COA79_09010 [Planctomycetota bacterium]